MSPSATAGDEDDLLGRGGGLGGVVGWFAGHCGVRGVFEGKPSGDRVSA